MARDQILFGNIELPNVQHFTHPREFGLGTIIRGGRIGGKSGRGRPRPVKISVAGVWIIDNPETNATGDNVDNEYASFVSAMYLLSRDGDTPLYLQNNWYYPCRLETITPQVITWSHIEYDATFTCDLGRRFNTTLNTLSISNNTSFSITSPMDTIVYLEISTTSGTTYTIKTDRDDGTITIVAAATSTLTLDLENGRAWRGTADARSEISGNFPEIPANTTLTLIMTGSGLTTATAKWYEATL